MTLLAKFNKLNKRERYAIMLGVGIAGIFLIFQFIIEPLFNKTEQKKHTLQTKSVMLDQMRQWQAVRFSESVSRRSWDQGPYHQHETDQKS